MVCSPERGCTGLMSSERERIWERKLAGLTASLAFTRRKKTTVKHLEPLKIVHFHENFKIKFKDKAL